jgi:hypothetical protein
MCEGSSGLRAHNLLACGLDLIFGRGKGTRDGGVGIAHSLSDDFIFGCNYDYIP